SDVAAPAETPVPVEAAEPPVQPAPAAAQPIVVPAAAPAPAVSSQVLHEVVSAAGLQWVETDPERHAQTQQRIAASYAPARLGRERKPVPPVSNEPLVQVETQRH